MLKTKHNLPFEAAPYELNFDSSKYWQRFRVGTCTGLYYFVLKTIEILAIENNVKNNGHFNDVLQWFMFSCKNNKRDLKILEVWNQQYSPNNLIKKV